jgi:hypothetical protein
MNEKNADMEKFKACITAAKSQDEIHKCREENRKTMKGMRAHHMDERMKKMHEHQEKGGDK